jgi:pantoate--beta-alanine ligase
MSRPQIVRKIKALRTAVAGWRQRGATIALVPTMGALHEGHISLVRLAQRRADRVVVSIFVNPAQFAPHEDFGTYPRTWQTDIAKLKAEKVDLVFAPAVAEVYPGGFVTRIEPEGPAKAGLEDRFRPHFFGGVATVVAKLLIEAGPDLAMFGEKDYQQLQVVTRMARDLDLPVKIVGARTVREKDGLALSSRNEYLSAEERKRAPELHRALVASAKRSRPGSRSKPCSRVDGSESWMQVAIDYLEARHVTTLEPITSTKEGPIRLLLAAKLGTTRLIDNIGV